MSRYIWDKFQGAFVPPEEYQRPEVQRSFLPCPMLSLDGMEATEHPLDQRHYESKSAFRAVTKAHGYTEIGNDPSRLKMREKPKPNRADIKVAVEKAKARVARGETV